MDEVHRIAEESGHAEVAQIQIGHMLTNAPPDPGGLWIHKAVVDILNRRDANDIRSEFTIELFNRRGIFNFTNGQEERELAMQNRERAEALDAEGFSRFAAAMREFAKDYDKQAEQQEKWTPYQD
ncbi:MAG: hypothetical protein JXR70_08580 [Spirochaetales bacterium]|nr:hypothetical protein [Spirochaetales bacterium]